jgi:hypothetical protein
MVIRCQAMRSIKGKEESHTHTHTFYPHYCTLPHLDPLPTARLPNTHLKRIDGSGTTGSHENRRNVKRYVHPCRCCTTILFISHYIPSLHTVHTLPFTSQSFIFYCRSSTIPPLSVHLSLFTAACRRHQSGQPQSTRTFLFTKQPLSLFFAFSILHLPTPCDTSHKSTLLQAPAAY